MRSSAPDPIAFFLGPSRGEAQLTKAMASPVVVRVESLGTMEDDALVLDQRIAEGDKPPRLRRWVMRAAGPGRWSGSLTDATGPVDIAREADALTIRYRMKNGIDVTQHLRQIDERTVDNRMSFRKFGMTLARLHETIRKS